MRLMMVFAAVGAAVLYAPSGYAADEDFFSVMFAKVQGGKPCYGRTYDDAHLKDHPKQIVRRIEIDMDKTDANARVNTAERFELGVAVMTTKSEEWYGNSAICQGGQDCAECFLDGDGGKFKLTAADGGAMRLEAGDYGIGFEGATDFIELKSDSGDDREARARRMRCGLDVFRCAGRGKAGIIRQRMTSNLQADAVLHAQRIEVGNV